MKYAICIYETKADFDQRSSPKAPEYWAAWKAYAAALGQTLTGGACLQGVTTATTLTIRNGKRQVQDGPYAETKEQLGGFMLIEAASLDEALDWAAKCPAAASGKVEVRPVVPTP